MKLKTPLFLAGALGVSVGLFSPPVVAQQPGATGEGQGESWYDCRVLPLKNVSPELMAWWLDPVHNVTPAAVLRVEPIFPEKPAPTAAEKAAQWRAQNPGLQMVAAQKELKRLLVIGTPEAIEKVEGLVAMLDQKLKEVEVVAQFVQIEPQYMQELGIKNFEDLAATDKPARFSLGFARAGIQERLTEFVAEGKAKVLDSQRVIAINNSATKIETQSASMASLLVDVENQTGPKTNTSGQLNPLEVRLLSTLYVTPSVNSDGSITMNIVSSRSVGVGITSRQIPLKTLEQRSSTANIRSGDTIALCGLTANANVADAINGVKGSNLVVLVTPTVLKGE